MGSVSYQTPLVVVVGETASGKSALAMELARLYDGELICADSRSVYRGMDIGTAKPSLEDQEAVSHHLLDVGSPDERFTAANFKDLALQAVQDIAGRGKLPILVGGTGLYIDSVLYDFQFINEVDVERRDYLNSLSVEELQDLLIEQGIELPENSRNPRYLVRALERDGQVGQRSGMRANTLVLGLQPTREQLEERIVNRVNTMVDDGFVEEVKELAKTYDFELDSFRTPGYKAFKRYIDGEISLDEAKELFVISDRQLAKRQRSWFKRNKSIHWIENSDQAKKLVQNFLSNVL